MHPDYGRQVGTAFEAVYQLHKDVSRLLTDVAAKLGDGRVNGTSVIAGMSASRWNPAQWMPPYVCMTSTGGKLPTNVVETVMVLFWNESPRLQEPYLVLARFTYTAGESGQINLRHRDTYDACFGWNQQLPVGLVNHYAPNDGRVEAFTLTAVPLFSITSVDDVLRHMETVRERAAM